jgi:hypothetical protein
MSGATRATRHRAVGITGQLQSQREGFPLWRLTAFVIAAIRGAITGIAQDAWKPIQYMDAVFDEAADRWISSAGSRRNTVHRVQFPETGRTRHRAPGRPEDPGPESARRRRTADHLRHLPVPRVLHHRHPGHRRRRQIPPRACHHRAGQRGPERQRPGAFTVRCFHGQRGLAGLGRHGVKPHPSRRNSGRERAGESPDRNDPPQTDQRPGQNRILRTEAAPSPPCGLALGDSLNGPVHPRLPRPAKT